MENPERCQIMLPNPIDRLCYFKEAIVYPSFCIVVPSYTKEKEEDCCKNKVKVLDQDSQIWY